MIKFKSVSYKNFLASGNIPIKINLENSGTTLIIGENGAGKSTMIEALVFALFNKSFRKVNKNQLVNSTNQKDCLVEVEFSIGSDEWKVCRGVKPNVFEIHQNGHLLNQSSSSIDQQRWLEQYVLKLNYKSFTQIVVLGSSTFVPFMQLPAAGRREVIEDLLDLKVFSNMNVILKEKVKELNEDTNELNRQTDIIKEKTKLQTKFIQTLEAKSESSIQDKLTSIKILEDQISELEIEREKLRASESELKENLKQFSDKGIYDTKINSVQSEIASAYSGIKTHSKHIRFFEDNTTCPSCKQEMGDELRDQSVSDHQKSIQKLEEHKTNLEKNLLTLRSEFDNLRILQNQLSQLLTDICNLNSKINMHQREINSHQDEIIKIKSDTTDIDSEKANVANLASQGLTLQRQVLENEQTLHRYSVLSTLLKDTGIKSTIIKNYLPVMNKLIDEHLKLFDFYINFTLDEEFNEIVSSVNRKDFTYTSFSEGERMRIDLALMFTWRAVAKLKNSANTNLLILDEVFDSSLDVTGTDDFLRIIKSISDSNSIFIISHKPDLPLDKFDRVLEFKKQKNFSTLAES